MSSKLKIFYGLIIVAVFASCQKDISSNPSPTPGIIGPFAVTVKSRAATQAQINWTKPSNTTQGTILYKTYLDAALLAQNLSDTFYTINNIVPNQSYQGKVVAYSSATDSSVATFSLQSYSTPAGPYDYLNGYYKVTETEFDFNNGADVNNLVFTGRVNIINDTIPLFYQNSRTPPTWWGANFSSAIVPAWNDSLNDRVNTVRGRVLNQNTIRLTYAYGYGPTVFSVSQVWEKLTNPADSNLYAYTWPVEGPGLIKTFAGNHIGNGSTFPTGDGGSALNATLSYPRTVYCDANQNVYIGDGSLGLHAVRKVNTSGNISLFAGNYSEGFSGDGGPATSAQLKYASGMVADAAGSIYISDAGNRVIRKVNAAGIISTIAGIPGSVGYSGDGGPATAAQLVSPNGITLDAAGNIYFADYGNHAVRKINTAGIITTIAGTGFSGFSGDGGLATSAKLKNPISVKLDAAGNIYIADRGNYVIRKINTSGIISTFAGTPNQSGNTGDGGTATAATLSDPYDIAFDQSGNLYVSGGGFIRKISTTGIITKLAGIFSSNTWSIGPLFYNGDNRPATAATLSSNYGIFVRGNILYAVDGNHRVRKIFL